MPVFRIYVEKKEAFAVKANSICKDLKSSLHLDGLKNVRVLNRYDVEGITEDVFQKASVTIFSEPAVDMIRSELPEHDGMRIFAKEYLPGQFDQRGRFLFPVHSAFYSGRSSGCPVCPGVSAGRYVDR